ncbi:hypothetical protein FB451DRAFT_363613 [Mycena latifolia]|nr:hypothetical protein FB451DRAFT_363613 [Mycena latifolia]
MPPAPIFPSAAETTLPRRWPSSILIPPHLNQHPCRVDDRSQGSAALQSNLRATLAYIARCLRSTRSLASPSTPLSCSQLPSLPFPFPCAPLAPLPSTYSASRISLLGSCCTVFHPASSSARLRTCFPTLCSGLLTLCRMSAPKTPKYTRITQRAFLPFNSIQFSSVCPSGLNSIHLESIALGRSALPSSSLFGLDSLKNCLNFLCVPNLMYQAQCAPRARESESQLCVWRGGLSFA